MKDQDVNKVYGKKEGVYSKGEILHVEKTVRNLKR